MYLIHVLSLIKINLPLGNLIYFHLDYWFSWLIRLARNHYEYYFHYFVLTVMYFFFDFRGGVAAFLLLLATCSGCFVGYPCGWCLRCSHQCLGSEAGLWRTLSRNCCYLILVDLYELEIFWYFIRVVSSLETFLKLILGDLSFFVVLVVFYSRCLSLVL